MLVAGSSNQGDLGSYKSLVHLSPVAAYLADADGRLVDANPALLSFLGYSESQLFLLSLSELFDRPVDYRHVQQQLVEQGAIYDLTLPIRTADKGVVPCLNTVVACQDMDGSFTALHGMLRPVEEAGERYLRIDNGLMQESPVKVEQLQQIVDAMPDGIVLLDREQRILHTNPAAQRYLAPIADATIGERLTNLGDKQLDGLLLHVPDCRWSEVAVEKLQRIFKIAAAPLQDGPQAGRWLLVLHDATEERERERQMRAQERMAAVGQLAAGISHDFNNILGVITLYTEMLLKTLQLSSQQREHLETVYEQAHRAAGLIRQILDLSHHATVDRQPLVLRPFVEEVVYILEQSLPANIELQVCYGDQHSTIANADRSRLQQVIMNLAANAQDAMPEGGRLHLTLDRLHLRTGDVVFPGMPAGDWITIAIADSGAGITPVDLPHVFEPFFTKKQRGKGKGLGLAQVYGIVQQHDGFIDVQSVPGKGTTFTIYLPALTLDTIADFEVDEDALMCNHQWGS